MLEAVVVDVVVVVGEWCDLEESLPCSLIILSL